MNDPGKRITSLWLYVSVDADGYEGVVYVSVDADGYEGVCAFPTVICGSLVAMPMVASDELRRDVLLHHAVELSRRCAMRIELRRFDGPATVEAVLAAGMVSRNGDA